MVQLVSSDFALTPLTVMLFSDYVHMPLCIPPLVVCCSVCACVHVHYKSICITKCFVSCLSDDLIGQVIKKTGSAGRLFSVKALMCKEYKEEENIETANTLEGKKVRECGGEDGCDK